MTRWRAAGIHLAISFVVIALVGIGLIGAWYGWELFGVMGGQRLLLLLAVIDIVIGPLLTLIVYKTGKPSLRFDLAVIALLQLGFLAYGLYVMASSRPVFLVGVADRFELVFASELDPQDIASAPDERFRKLSLSGPVLVGGLMGQTSQERYQLTMSGFAGKDIQHMPDRYVDYAQVSKDLLAQSKPAEELAATSETARRKLEAAAKDIGRPLAQLRTLPIISKRGRATMLMDPESGAPLRPVEVDPWTDLPPQ
jgi:hypothetical protein